MGFFDVFKAIFIPGLIAAFLYLLLAYALIPLWRKHHARYSQYIPLDTISSHTSSLRARLKHKIFQWLTPASMRWRQEVVVDGRGGEEEFVFGEEEGESMVGFGDVSREREGRVRVVGGSREDRVGVRRGERLSRDLEEGFRDSSSEEGEEGQRRVEMGR